MKSRPAMIMLALLLLAGTHAAVFWLARGSGGAGDGELREASYLPAKSVDRGKGPSSSGGGGSFHRLLGELERSGMSRQDFDLARAALVREWIRRDLRSAMELLLDPQAGNRYDDLRQELEKDLAAQIVRQPREAWDWIAARRFGTNGSVAFDVWSSALMDAGQTDVLLECLSGDWHFASSELVRRLADKVPAAQLPQLRALLAARPDLLVRDEGSLPYSKRMAAEAGSDPMPFLATEKNEALRLAFVHDWAERELKFLPAPAAVEVVGALPDDVSDYALLDVVRISASSGGSAALAEMLNAAEAKGLLDDPYGEKAILYVNVGVRELREGSLTTLTDAYRALQGIDDERLRHLVLRRLGGAREKNGGAQAYLDFLAAVPAGPDRDAFLRDIATREEMEPGFREQLLAGFSSPEVAADALRERAEDERRAAEMKLKMEKWREEEKR